METRVWETLFEPAPRAYAAQIKHNGPVFLLEKNPETYNDRVVQRRILKALFVHRTIKLDRVPG